MSKKSEPKQSQEVKSQPKWDARKLSGLVCCSPKWQPIYDVMKTLSPDELKEFKQDLLKHSGLSSLHEQLEQAFKQHEKAQQD